MMYFVLLVLILGAFRFGYYSYQQGDRTTSGIVFWVGVALIILLFVI